MNCIARGCTNVSKDGRFVNDLCAPCHSKLVTGHGDHGTSVLFAWPERIKKLEDALREIIMRHEDNDPMMPIEVAHHARQALSYTLETKDE